MAKNTVPEFEEVVAAKAKEFHIKRESLYEAIVEYLPEAVAREIARQVVVGEVSKPFNAEAFPTPEELRAMGAEDDKEGS